MKSRGILGSVAIFMLMAGLVIAQPQRGQGQRGGDGAGGQRGVRPGQENREGQATGPRATRPGQENREGQGTRPAMGGRDPEQMRQMMSDRMRQQLGATEAEWKLIGPRVQRVTDLNRDASSTGRGMMAMGGMFGGRGPGAGGPGGPGAGGPGAGGPGAGRPGDAPQREQSAVDKASEELRTALANENSTPEQVKTALTNLRNAREKARQDLAKAQQELRELLTVRQEAICVMMGLLP